MPACAPASGGQTIAEGIAVKEPGASSPGRSSSALVERHAARRGRPARAGDRAAGRQQKIVAEGGGAAALAAMLAQPERFAGRKVGARRLAAATSMPGCWPVLMRGLVRQGRVVTSARADHRHARRARPHRRRHRRDRRQHHRDLPPAPVLRPAGQARRPRHRRGDPEPQHVQEIIQRLSREGFATRQLSGRSG